jgi:hypothetical protein
MTAAAPKYTATAPSWSRKVEGKVPGARVATSAVDISDADAHRDQREHLEATADGGLPSPHKERPAGPEYDGSREQELDPVRQRLVDPAIAAHEVPAHLQHHDRSG